MNASNNQIGGTHYKDMGDYQPWDVLQHWLTPEEYRGYQKGVAIAYLARERAKGGDQDLRKALHHLQKMVEVLDQQESSHAAHAHVVVQPQPEYAPESVAIDDGWIEWSGGDCPVDPDTIVRYRLRGYDGIFGSCRAKLLSWNMDFARPSADIIAYRVIKPA